MTTVLHDPAIICHLECDQCCWMNQYGYDEYDLRTSKLESMRARVSAVHGTSAPLSDPGSKSILPMKWSSYQSSSINISVTFDRG